MKSGDKSALAVMLESSQVKELVERIEELLPNVTPGEWAATSCMDYWIEAPDEELIAHCGDIRWPDFKTKQSTWESNAQYFLATQPSVLRALLAERASLLAQVEKAGEVIKPFAKMSKGEPDTVLIHTEHPAFRAARQWTEANNV